MSTIDNHSDDHAWGRDGRGPNDGSLVARRLGTFLFWALVIAIVSARVALFQPDLFATLHETPDVPAAESR